MEMPVARAQCSGLRAQHKMGSMCAPAPLLTQISLHVPEGAPDIQVRCLPVTFVPHQGLNGRGANPGIVGHSSIFGTMVQEWKFKTHLDQSLQSFTRKQFGFFAV